MIDASSRVGFSRKHNKHPPSLCGDSRCMSVRYGATGWVNPSLGTVMKEHRRGRVGRAVLHRNSLSRPSSPTSMRNKGPHRPMQKSGIPFIPVHFIDSNSSFLITLKERHCLMYCIECLQFYVLSECVPFFSFFTVPSCSFRDT